MSVWRYLPLVIFSNTLSAYISIKIYGLPNTLQTSRRQETLNLSTDASSSINVKMEKNKENLIFFWGRGFNYYFFFRGGGPKKFQKNNIYIYDFMTESAQWDSISENWRRSTTYAYI